MRVPGPPVINWRFREKKGPRNRWPAAIYTTRRPRTWRPDAREPLLSGLRCLLPHHGGQTFTQVLGADPHPVGIACIRAAREAALARNTPRLAHGICRRIGTPNELIPNFPFVGGGLPGSARALRPAKTLALARQPTPRCSRLSLSQSWVASPLVRGARIFNACRDPQRFEGFLEIERSPRIGGPPRPFPAPGAFICFAA